MTLYLKYRPQTLDELDSESVREQLKKIVASGDMPHGFLFAGPKGIGKTSAARILAKIINCDGKEKPCNKCEQCVSITKGNNIDVIEIDAASNRGIDDIRSLKENIMLAPNLAKKKIYIVDEAHMLTTEASNAFLKTLEEPPDHVVFILATTDPQKLPETVRSRLMTVNFKKATDEEIARQIARVAKGEGIIVDKEAIAALSKIADGSFRDAAKIFEQLGEKITKEAVEKFRFSGKVFDIKNFADVIKNRDPKEILSQIAKFNNEGISMKYLLDSLIEQTRQTITEKESIYLIELLIEARSRMRDAFIPQLSLEIALLKFCGEQNTPPKEKIAPQDQPKKVRSGSTIDGDTWKEILSISRSKNTSVEALLRAAEPMDFDGSNLTLGVYYKFHKERLETIENKRILETVVNQIFGNPIKITFELTEKKYEPKAGPAPVEAGLTAANDNDIISAAKEIFGQ